VIISKRVRRRNSLSFKHIPTGKIGKDNKEVCYTMEKIYEQCSQVGRACRRIAAALEVIQQCDNEKKVDVS